MTAGGANDPGPGSPMPPAPAPVGGPGRPRRRGARATAVVATMALLVLAAVVSWSSGFVPCDTLQAQPSCNVSMLPGPAEDVDDLIDVAAPNTYGSDGELVLTTVVLDSNLTVDEYVRGLLDDSTEVLDRDVVYPEGRSVQDARVANEIMMSDSQLTAKVAALEYLGVDLEGLTAGAEVVTVLPDTPAADGEALAAGDVITAVDGTPVGNADEAVAAIGALAPGDTVTVTIGEQDEANEVRVVLGENPDDSTRPFVGVLLRDFQVLPYEIDIEAGAIGGPSAGLLFSLGIVDRLTEVDLTNGQVIAGTGTINAEGLVGPIGGIVQKVTGAAQRDDPAEVFLVPDGNWDAAMAARPASDITLVRVTSLSDAVTTLEQLAAGMPPDDVVALGPDGPVATEG